MTTVAALVYLHRMGFEFRAEGGRLLCRAPAAPPADAAAALAVLRAHRDEAAALLAWPPDSWEAAARFGHADALLYPYLGCEVDAPAGPAVLRQVLGGWAVVHRAGAERVERVRVSDVRPAGGVGARVG